MADARLETPDPSPRSANPSEVLVADNDPYTADLCRTLLRDQRVTVRTARDSEMVMDALESGLVDILLLSEELPESQGFELLRHIHYWYPETQVIVVADRPSYPSAVQAAKLGAFDYLPKPLEPALLQHTIERAMEQYRMEAGKFMRESPDAEGAYGIVGTS